MLADRPLEPVVEGPQIGRDGRGLPSRPQREVAPDPARLERAATLTNCGLGAPLPGGCALGGFAFEVTPRRTCADRQLCVRRELVEVSIARLVGIGGPRARPFRHNDLPAAFGIDTYVRVPDVLTRQMSLAAEIGAPVGGCRCYVQTASPPPGCDTTQIEPGPRALHAS